MDEIQELWQSILNNLSENKIRFQPIRGLQTDIDRMPLSDGSIYFATDSKMIWLDANLTDKVSGEKTLSRILMGNGAGGGSGNVGFIYANASFEAGSLKDALDFPDELGSDEYYIFEQAFGSDVIGLPLVDTLIINSNGWFFRVTARGEGDYGNRVKARLISSGTGGGGGGESGSQAENIHFRIVSFPTNLINGRDADIVFIPYAAKDRNGIELDSETTVAWTLEYTETGNSYIQYATGILEQLPSGQEYSFNFGARARHSAKSRLTLVISELNSTNTQTWSSEFISSDLKLTLPSSFSNSTYYNTDSMPITCYQSGNMDKLLEFYWDNTLICSKELDNQSSTEQSINVINYVDEITHGYHKVKIVLSQYIGNKKGFSVEPIEFEVATRDPNSDIPIIWLGNYKTRYYNYDNIQIPFRVFVARDNAEVHLYKDGKELEGSPRTITDDTQFSIFEIVDFDLNMLNNYAITCEQDPEHIVSRTIEFTVEQDPLRRDFGIQKKGYLTLDFDASGRSNSESPLKRASWSYKDSNGLTKSATFTNFNWYNNGWITEKNKTCLRISNGASFSIPIGDMVFAGQNDKEQSHSFEFQFKIRNVQDYSNLIHNITRYKNDSIYFNEFYDTEHGTYKTDYTNYDAFLANYFKNNHVSYLDTTTGIERDMEYDDLEFDRVEKQINLSAVACGFFSGNNQSVVGICLGPQDAFFSNGTNTVNVDYVEDNIINLTAVYQHTTESINRLMYIYINGVLTGVIRNSLNGPFSIVSTDNTEKAIVFNSNYCDIDLYKIRFYRTNLNVNDVVTNFAVDLKDVLIYDQNKLAIENNAIKEYQFSYTNMMDYNSNHLNSPIMPYIVFDTSKTNNGDKLSYAKSVKLKIGVEFVNTPLELAYTSGELETLSGPQGAGLWADGATAAEKAEAVKTYYQHHCPSWKGENIQMAVQGTSSEFYPRRNYKLKTKDENDDINILLNRGPFAADYEKDMRGLTMQKYIISDQSYDENLTYYSDNQGTTAVTFDDQTHYVPNRYYIENPDYVQKGKEKTRQKYWYMDNDTVGTTKFTMKIDFMESSGTYNMGFANMVKNAYSKHPLADYNSAGAFVVEDPTITTEEVATSYKAGTVYYYRNHKGNWKSAESPRVEDNLEITSQEDFDKGPWQLAQEQQLGTLGMDKVKVAAEGAEGYNTWYKRVPGYKRFEIEHTDDYRTSVQGFRTLAFHKKSDGTYTYIGMYNMLLDKGSDEVYGFKPDKTTGADVLQKYLNNKKVSKIAECWEFENNSRTFCSFRDPMNRKDLSFNVYTLNSQNEQVPVLNSMRSAPVVVDSFEYRYHPDGDILDYVMDPDKNGDKLEASDTIAYMTKNNLSLSFNKDDVTQNYQERADLVFKDYKNWERAVAWVWSTNADSVLSGGVYEPVEGLGNLWTENTYYLFDSEHNTYVLDTANAWDPSLTYYVLSDAENGIYNPAYLGSIEYTKNTYYIDRQGEKVLSIDDFNPEYTYYSFISKTNEDMENDNRYDRLVTRCTDDSVFDANINYYTYDGEQPAGSAVTRVSITESEFNENKKNYWTGITVQYGPRSYQFDTKEYRIDKFINELEEHFDIEYLSTYFVMTEVFECYDSRGKNAMFATWGPQRAGGDYIWYPIFYDIDTQLGINNTGIPSFEYNVDATEDGNYSTSDSVLWNNFYKYFKSSRILMKYKHLKGVTAGVSWNDLANPPLRSVENIEAWYCTDPDVCKSIVMRGRRPLIAVNLDEYYKYITITNTLSYQNGVTGHIASDTSGTWTYDPGGTYFYALQGNRSLSRQQFLTNRLEYIDSWLNQGNYARGGNNRMWGRVAANNPVNTSDEWVENPNDPSTSYWLDQEETQKRHEFDAEYWLTLTPTHSTYVTLGDDNEAYPSQKYNGIDPVKFEISSIQTGVRQSYPYPEQLLYVYGMNQMSDVGDMSKMYWQEFKIEGEAKHLTRLLLGYDGLSEENGELIRWHNDKLNPPTIPASKEASGMPLLKEVNFSNIQISKEPRSLDLTSCEKLQNFRATGSNLTEVKLAEGVALNTLYLPNSITRLELIEARLLTTLLTEEDYEIPQKVNNKLVAKPGLYIDGLFSSNASTNLAAIKILGGNLGYNSYKLLKQFFTVRGGAAASSIASIDMTDVKWSPWELVEEDEIYNGSEENYRFVDNHFGLKAFTYSEGDWATQVANHEIYKRNNATAADIGQISDISMLVTFINENNYKSEKTPIPNITGTIYIDNEVAVDEAYIRNTIQPCFPKLTFLFTRVTQKPSARFVYFEEDNVTYRYVNESPISIQTLNSATDSSEWFENPITEYGNLDKLRNNYDFFGWAIRVSDDAIGDNVYTMGIHKYQVLVSNTDGEWIRPEGTLELDYTFYAVFKLHQFSYYWYNTMNESDLLIVTKQEFSPRGHVEAPKDNSGKEIIPALEIDNPDTINLEKTNKFIGWARWGGSQVEDLNTIPISIDNMKFVAVYTEVSVYDNVLDSQFLSVEDDNENNGIAIGLNPDYSLSGKITLPTIVNNKVVTRIGSLTSTGSLSFTSAGITHIFWERENRGLITIGASCFMNCTNLRYYEQPNTCTTIYGQAFQGCTNLGQKKENGVLTPTNYTIVKNILQYITNIKGQSGIFNQCVNLKTVFIPGHKYDEIINGAFGGLNFTENCYLGGPGDPCEWNDMLADGMISTNSKLLNGLGARGSCILHIYTPTMYSNDFLNALGYSSNTTPEWGDPYQIITEG